MLESLSTRWFTSSARARRLGARVTSSRNMNFTQSREFRGFSEEGGREDRTGDALEGRQPFLPPTVYKDFTFHSSGTVAIYDDPTTSHPLGGPHGLPTGYNIGCYTYW